MTILDTSKLDDLMSNFPKIAETCVRSGAEAVQGKAASLAPIDTGALRNSIHIEKVDSLTYQVADGVEYGIYQEFGTYRMAAHPFMVPAVYWAEPQYIQLWKAALNG